MTLNWQAVKLGLLGTGAAIACLNLVATELKAGPCTCYVNGQVVCQGANSCSGDGTVCHCC